MEFFRKVGLELRSLGPVHLLALSLKVITLVVAPFTLMLVPTKWTGSVTEWFICILFTIAIVLLIEEQFRWHRKARYAEAMNFIHDAFHKLRDATWELKGGASDKDIHPHLKGALRAYAAAFSMVTGAYCRLCIKLLLVDDPSPSDPKPRPYVETLQRHDNTASPTKQFERDFADLNTDFWVLMKNPNERCFCSNNLLKWPGYHNSHWPAEEITRDKLSYISTMVWPIRKMVPGPGDADEPENIGFLCVDSKTRGIFQRRYDFSLGAAFADALYGFIREWRDARGSLQSLVLKRESTTCPNSPPQTTI